MNYAIAACIFVGIILATLWLVNWFLEKCKEQKQKDFKKSDGKGEKNK